jgi:hypothetical protein
MGIDPIASRKIIGDRAQMFLYRPALMLKMPLCRSQTNGEDFQFSKFLCGVGHLTGNVSEVCSD